MTKHYNYKKKSNGKNDTGVPLWEPTPAQLKILEDYFKLGSQVKEALAKARIPSSTFYDYLKRNKDFSEQIAWWQEYPTIIARHSVVAQMATDGKLALEYLKCKKKDEFGTRTELTGVSGSPIVISQEFDFDKLKQLREMIDKE